MNARNPIKNFLTLITVTLLLAAANAQAAEEWKGKGYEKPFQFSGLMGLSIQSGQAGFGLSALLAKQILEKGFFPDINNQVYIEAGFGPTFLRVNNDTTTGFQIAAHMRWDFHKNELLSLYALGGLGWDIIPVGLSNEHTIHPRFGVGVFWHLFPQVSFRGEISHEFTGVGASFMF